MIYIIWPINKHIAVLNPILIYFLNENSSSFLVFIEAFENVSLD